MKKFSDQYWLTHALKLAEKAQHEGEVPIGAVLVLDNQVIGEGWNQSISSNDPCAHAEVVALRQAAKAINNYRLLNSTLYVTLEPCAMCVGASVHARIERLVFGAKDPKAGAVCSVLQLLDSPHFNHRIKWDSDVMAEPCGDLLRKFFQVRRKNL